MIQYKRKQGFEFVFLGANQDAIKTGSRLGFPQQSCLTFIANEASCTAMMDRVSKQIQRSISLPASQIEFSQVDRELSQVVDLSNYCPSGFTTRVPNPNATSALEFDFNKHIKSSSKTTCDTCDTEIAEMAECSQLPDDSTIDMEYLVKRKIASTTQPRFKRCQTLPINRNIDKDFLGFVQKTNEKV